MPRIWRTSRRVACGVALVAWCAFLSGCGTFALNAPKVPDVTPERQKREAEAIREFEAKRNRAEFEAALSRWSSGDTKGCQEHLEQIIKRDPNHGDALLLLAELHLAKGEASQALEHLEHLATVAPSDAAVEHRMALASERLGDTLGALAHYRRAVELAPQDEALRLDYEIALEQTGVPLDQIPVAANPNPQEVAQVSFERADRSRTTPSEPESPEQLLTPVASAEPTAPESTTATLGGSSQLDAVSAEARRSLEKGEHVLKAGASSPAITFFRQAMASEPDNPQIPISAATLALRYNQPQTAIALLSEAVERFPDQSGVHRVMGLAHYRAGNYQASEVALNKALSLDRTDALTYFLLGSTVSKLGRGDEAQRLFFHAHSMDPHLPIRR